LSARIYVARRAFSVETKEGRKHIYRGQTTQEGHWLLKQCAENFEPLKVTYPVDPVDEREQEIASSTRSGGRRAAGVVAT
jgi:hypothetical protein